MEIFMIASWNIWKEMNKSLFEGIAPTISSWKTRVKTDLLFLVHRTKSDLHPIITHIVADLWFSSSFILIGTLVPCCKGHNVNSVIISH
jgi:hypothetical protein